MEYVEGLDLARMVKARGPMPVGHACHYARQAALGLQHAHERGMVHRDIKPGNLMLSRHGDRAVIKVLDFGLAKAGRENKVVPLGPGDVQPLGAAETLTLAGQMLGTPDFIAPEQIDDARGADIRADIYSLGCTLYFLLAGGPPFHGATLYDILQAQHSMDAPPLNFVRPEVPSELAALVAKMMAKEPGRRFQTPDEVAKALAPFYRRRAQTPVAPGLGASPIEATATSLSMAGSTQVATESAAAPAPTPLAARKQGRPEEMWKSLIDLTEAEKPSPTPAVAPRPVPKHPRWIWPAVAGLAGFVAVVLGAGITYRIATDKGELVIETDDPSIEVVVKQGGKLVTILDPKTSKTLVLNSGRYELKLDGERDGLRLSTETFTLKRGDKAIVTVRRVDSDSPRPGLDRHPERLEKLVSPPNDGPILTQNEPQNTVSGLGDLKKGSKDEPVGKASVPLGRCIIEPFDYRGVTLDAGPLKQQVDEVRALYLAIPDDDLLKGFRSRAGRPAPGKDLGGWYSSDTFLVFGQIVSGLARLHGATGNPACRDKANRLIEGWAKCIGPDGYFYASHKPNAPHYIYDKMLWGLLDVHAYCGNREALVHLGRITDWAVKNLDRSRRVNDTATEWYTLSENLYRAFLATGQARYRDFAQVWEYRDYWDIYVRDGDIFAPRPDGGRNLAYHAYSHVNTLGGAGAAYRVTGDRRYLDLLRHAYEFLQRNQCFATGGFGPDEQLLPVDRLREKLGETHNSFETQCGSWAAFKLAKYLISFTGDAQYGDWIERLTLNGIGASPPMTPDGRVFYYSDYDLHGGTKRNTDLRWSCCTGTRPQAVADYTDLIYFRDAGALYINLFTPSTVAWQQVGEPVKLTQTTNFPESDEVRLKLALARPSEFGFQIRTPGWLAAPIEARVNGVAAELRAGDRHWAGLRRLWRDNDVISVRLPMKPWCSRLDPRHPTPAAVLHGPVVLAFEAPSANLLRRVNLTDLGRVLRPDDGVPLHYRLAGDPSVVARPFASYGPGRRYFIYLYPEAGRRIPPADLTFTGRWDTTDTFRASNEVGATAEGQFVGTGVRWLGWRFDDAGTAEVSIDGQVVGLVDQYGPGRGLPFDWRHRGLPPGRHTIRIRVLPRKPEASSGFWLNVGGLEVLTDPAP
jgi:hypothetical protein